MQTLLILLLFVVMFGTVTLYVVMNYLRYERHPITVRHKNYNFKFLSKQRYVAPYCKGIILGNALILNEARHYMKSNPQEILTEQDYINLIDELGCEYFRRVRGYKTSATSLEEEEFPIAFGVSMYKNIEQAERLLRMIYMPQNYYCFHIDNKTAISTVVAMTKIAKCFPNVMITSKSFNVQWGMITVLDADMQCMRDLLAIKKPWKYYVGLAGEELPLTSNRQLVRLLKIFNGANNVWVDQDRSRWSDRWLYTSKNKVINYSIRKTPAPYGLKVQKGEIHIMGRRDFIEYITSNPVAMAFYEWLKDTLIPDEAFYATLTSQQNMCIPGAYNGKPGENPNYVVRHKIWRGVPRCYGKTVHEICVKGIGDIGELVNTATKLKIPFLNKIYSDFEYLAFDCMEQYMQNLTLQAQKINFEYDLNDIKNANFIKHKTTCRK